MKKLIFYIFWHYPKIALFSVVVTLLFFTKNIRKNYNSKFKFLVLNKKRFNKDLYILAEDQDFSFFLKLIKNFYII